LGLLFSAFYHPINPNTGAATRTGDSPIFVGIVIFAVLAFFGFLYSIRSGASLVLRVARARPANQAQYPQLYDLVSALAIGEGIPAPAIYLIDDPSPNAFATGVSPDKASITFTIGLLQIMNREELEGVIGHEMSHIKNHDIRLLLIVGTMIGMRPCWQASCGGARFRWSGTGREEFRCPDPRHLFRWRSAGHRRLPGGSTDPPGTFSAPGIAGRCQRVELTRNPAGLLSALRKLQQNDKPFANFNHATPLCASTTRCSTTRPGTTTSTTLTLPSRSGSLSSRRSPRVSQSDRRCSQSMISAGRRRSPGGRCGRKPLGTTGKRRTRGCGTGNTWPEPEKFTSGTARSSSPVAKKATALKPRGPAIRLRGKVCSAML